MQKAEGTYIEALARGKWQINDNMQVMQSTRKPIRVEGAIYPLKLDLLRRCMVGRFIGKYENPTHNAVCRWIYNTGKDAYGVQV